MPVPSNLHIYRPFIIPVPSKDENDNDPNLLSRPPKPIYTSKFENGRIISGVEAFLGDSHSYTDREVRKTSLTSSSVHASHAGGGYHRSRERTRQSAVQRLVERKLAQKEKERVKERDRSWVSSKASINLSCSQNASSGLSSFLSNSCSRENIVDRDRSGTRSENGFSLGSGRCSSPSKDDLDSELFFPRPRRTARSCSGTRIKDLDGFDEPTTKTYITIGPGKPTRIREQSPSKSAKLSPEETVTSARERSAQSRSSSPYKINSGQRSVSPSPQRKSRDIFDSKIQISRGISDHKNAFMRTASPLKSTNILKTFKINGESPTSSTPNSDSENVNVKRNSCSTSERRLSIEILKSVYRPEFSEAKNLPDSEISSQDSSPVSSISSPLSGSTDSVGSNGFDKQGNIHLSQRRISLEQRFQARTRFVSPERLVKSSETFTTRSEVLGDYSEEFVFKCKTRRTKCESRTYSTDSSDLNIKLTKPIPALRKISLPQTAGKKPEPAPRRRSLHTILSPERLAEDSKEEGNQLYKVKNYRDAIEKYTTAIDLCPDHAPFYGNRSACYLMLGQPSKSLDDARKSIKKDAAFAKGWSRVARCCVLLGDTVSAKQALTKLVELGGDSTSEQANVSLVERMSGDSQQAYNSKDYRKALYCLDKALGIATNSVSLKTARAECLAFLGRYPEAAEAANSVLQSDNTNAEALYVRGLCLYYEDNVDAAFSHFTRVLRLAPDHQKAKEIYKKARSLKAKKEEGNTAFKSGNLDEAYKLYSEALEIDPYNRSTNAKLYFNRATVASKLKKTSECIEDCDRALELDPGYTKALLRRSKSYMEIENYEEAVRDYEKLWKGDRGNMDYRHLLQEAKLELKKSKRKDFYKILAVDKTANEEEIKKAYRKRAMVHHPDRHSGATEQEKREHETKFKEVGEAYAVLSDDKKRRMYDSGQDIEEGGGGGYQDVDPNSIFQAFFGGGGGHGGMGGMGGGGGHQHFQFGGNPGAQSFSFQFG